MQNKENFFVGWKDEVPRANYSFIKNILVALFIAIPLLTLVVVKFQKKFNDHKFELGNVKPFEGIYHEKPVPILEVSQQSVPEGFSNFILLVGYGKFGAEGILREIEQNIESLDGKKITIMGSMIYGDGKVLLELTEKEKSLIKIHEQPVINKPSYLPGVEINLVGEILDPKCYFGVMKPGEGKIHKSCAIRCISGGIPPVFRTSTGKNNEVFEYYLLLGEEGKKINKSILTYVAEPANITGLALHMYGWNILYTSSISLIK